ncbi:hypothetical protein LR48_Vigan07g146000 [Vigna angularis]|uniref:Uncharacterized protein n=1 Tax=Phaseolus angularis TaxID=3914 RepID=A0A0L9UYI5_PHAAN|nr:hypothetical protein LR48_Vigan07g146000 [Vigna angularis]
MRKCHAEELGLESPDLAPPPARHELWKAARTKSNGQFKFQYAKEISQRIDDLVDQQSQGTFVAQGREDLLVAAAGRLDRPSRVCVVDRTDYNIQYEFLVDEDPPHVVVVGRQIAGGQTIHGASLSPTHAREDEIGVEVLDTNRFNTTSSFSTSVIKMIREDWAGYLNKHF